MIVRKFSEERRGKNRMVINYKKLNSIAIRNRYRYLDIDKGRVETLPLIVSYLGKLKAPFTSLHP